MTKQFVTLSESAQQSRLRLEEVKMFADNTSRLLREAVRSRRITEIICERCSALMKKILHSIDKMKEKKNPSCCSQELKMGCAV